MALPKHYALQVFAYTAIIFVVMWWSGWKTEKTIYDSVVVRLEGEIMFVSDPLRAQDFYERVMAFTPLADGNGESAEILLPDRSVVRLQRASNESQRSQGILLIRVRNAIDRLHAELVRRNGQRPYKTANANYIESMEPGRVSELVSHGWGQEFVVADHDGNRIVFHKPNRGKRYGD